MASRAERNNRPGRESLKKRLGVKVCRCSHLVRHYQIQVLRSDGSPLSTTEEREVRALLAAHAAEPLAMPSK